jgi:hypothetical protein
MIHFTWVRRVRIITLHRLLSLYKDGIFEAPHIIRVSWGSVKSIFELFEPNPPFSQKFPVFLPEQGTLLKNYPKHHAKTIKLN